MKQKHHDSSLKRTTGSAQVAYKAETEIAALTQQIADLDERIEQAQNEQRQIDNRVKWQQEQLMALRSHVERLREKHKEEESYANLAAGTVGERNAIVAMRQAETAANDAQKDLEQAEHQAAKQITTELERREKLAADIAQWTHDKHAAERERREKQAHLQRALTELGQETMRSELTRLEALRLALEAKQAEVASVQRQLDEALEAAIQNLSDWREHQTSIRQRYASLYRDDVVDLLSAKLAFLEALRSYHRIQSDVPPAMVSINTDAIRSYPQSISIPIEETHEFIRQHRQSKLLA